MSTKTKILEVSLELFAKKGFDGVSVREIAKEVGVRESALYKHYKNKEDILEKIVEEMIVSIRSGYELRHVPETLAVGVVEGYRNITEEQLCEMSWSIFKMFTEDFRLSNFRRLLMREQFQNKIIAEYYNKFFLKGVIECQTAHCGRYIPHFDFSAKPSPIVPYRHLPQSLSGMTADCRSLV